MKFKFTFTFVLFHLSTNSVGFGGSIQSTCHSGPPVVNSLTDLCPLDDDHKYKLNLLKGRVTISLFGSLVYWKDHCILYTLLYIKTISPVPPLYPFFSLLFVRLKPVVEGNKRCYVTKGRQRLVRNPNRCLGLQETHLYTVESRTVL